ncbi:type II toxin-antitoxin system RelE/ParE family toxin [Asticcacaulis solisilvae]|uniref:type II toxin-antitoxin system RelE/ParE family toxin n=1 Tax=Asticcacaulis solisilvae TaxID=1217274 RepID=UPI003FD7C8FC
MPRYSITTEAAHHLREIARWGADRWGVARARSYLEDLRAGFEFIAQRPQAVPQRTRLTGPANLRLHRVRNHYVVFTLVTDAHVVIVGVLHERMDVPARLEALQARTQIGLDELRVLDLRNLPGRD